LITLLFYVCSQIFAFLVARSAFRFRFAPACSARAYRSAAIFRLPCARFLDSSVRSACTFRFSFHTYSRARLRRMFSCRLDFVRVVLHHAGLPPFAFSPGGSALRVCTSFSFVALDAGFLRLPARCRIYTGLFWFKLRVETFGSLVQLVHAVRKTLLFMGTRFHVRCCCAPFTPAPSFLAFVCVHLPPFAPFFSRFRRRCLHSAAIQHVAYRLLPVYTLPAGLDAVHCVAAFRCVQFAKFARFVLRLVVTFWIGLWFYCLPVIAVHAVSARFFLRVCTPVATRSSDRVNKICAFRSHVARVIGGTRYRVAIFLRCVFGSLRLRCVWCVAKHGRCAYEQSNFWLHAGSALDHTGFCCWFRVRVPPLTKHAPRFGCAATYFPFTLVATTFRGLK